MKMRAMLVMVGLVLASQLYAAKQADDKKLAKKFAELIDLTDDSDALKLIKEYPALLTYKDAQNNTALHWLVSKGAAKVVKLLLQNKVLEMGGTTRIAALLAQDREQETPFMLAVKKGDKATVSVILASLKGLADNDRQQVFEAVNSYGKNVMHFAAYGNSEILKLLLQTDDGCDLLKIQDSANGYTPLHIAASNNKKENCALIMQYPNGLASMTILDKRRAVAVVQDVGPIVTGKTPFNVAREESRKAFESIRLFLTGKKGASEKEWTDAIKTLEQSGIFDFVRNAQIDQLKKYLKVLPGFVTEIREGKRPLHVALEQDPLQKKVVEELFKGVQGKAMLEKPDNGGDTPLHLVAQKLADADESNKEKLVALINLFADKAPKAFRRAADIRNKKGKLPQQLLGDKRTLLSKNASRLIEPDLSKVKLTKDEATEAAEPFNVLDQPAQVVPALSQSPSLRRKSSSSQSGPEEGIDVEAGPAD